MRVANRRPIHRPSSEDKRLDRQFEYQKFHIGIYVSLATAIIGASVFAKQEFNALGIWKLLVPGAIVFLLLAGMCGGFVASAIPSAKSFEEFRSSRLGFVPPWWLVRLERVRNLGADAGVTGWQKAWCRTLASPARWESYEHFFFWLAMLQLAALGSVVALSGVLAPAAPDTNSCFSGEAQRCCQFGGQLKCQSGGTHK